jgi:NAD(P)-dependent dehydrogenase (short-subunit alcohol dehydrogenase family)
VTRAWCAPRRTSSTATKPARRRRRTVPLGRLAFPSEIGDVCVFLASPLASYVTGANLVAHGGGDKPPFLDAANT